MHSVSSTKKLAQKPGGVAQHLLFFFLMFAPVASAAEGIPKPILDDWSKVLHTFVNAHGQINFDALARHPEELHRVVRYIGRVSPRSAPDQFPTKASKLAYYINAYNALAMYNVIDSGIPKQLSWWRRIVFFGIKKFSVGGKRLSLYSLENELIRPLGDERIHFGLNCMVVGCPRLPREPFTADTLDEQLGEAATIFFSEARNLSVDVPGRVIHVSSILEFYTEDFLQRAPTLIAYLDRYVKISEPLDYAVKFMPYDWTVNKQ